MFVVSFVEFLAAERLLLWQEAAARLYLTTDRTQATDDIESTAKLYLDLEDFLHGLISLSNELVSGRVDNSFSLSIRFLTHNPKVSDFLCLVFVQ